MTRDIGILTTSGKAYYQLVSEVKRRGLQFISLTPKEFIPFEVKVIITTKSDSSKIDFPEILIFDELQDPFQIIDDAIQLLRGKKTFHELIIGIDPGKRSGLVVLGDGIILKKMELINIEEKVKDIIQILKDTQAENKTVKIGNGVKTDQQKLFTLLNAELPPNVIIESVEEEGTTKKSKKEQKEHAASRDVLSAIKISMRNGQELNRTRYNGKTC